MGLLDIFKKKAPGRNIEITISVPQPARSPVVGRVSDNPYPDSYQCDILEQRELFREAIKQAVPSKNGLYPHELLMLDYATTFYAQGENRFQGFWLYETHIENPQAVLNSLEERGFIAPGGLKATLARETATTLKEELKRFNLKVTGKKADLIQRLLDEGDHKELEKRFPRSRYQLTELGTKELKQNEYIHYIHRQKHFDLNVWSLNLLIGRMPGFSYRDVIWKHFNEQSGKHFVEHNFGLYRNTRYNMCIFLMEEKEYQGAFQMIVEVIYWELSGCDNGWSRELEPLFYQSNLERYFPYSNTLVDIAPGVLDTLINLMTELAITEETLRSQLTEEFEKLQTPMHLFTKEECADIVIAEMNEDINTLERIYKVAEKRFRRNAPRKI